MSDLSLFLYAFGMGAFFMYMVLAAWFFSQSKSNPVHRVTRNVLIYWAFLSGVSFLVCTYYAGFLHISSPVDHPAHERAINLINMLRCAGIPAVAMLGLAITYSRRVTFGFFALHVSPCWALVLAYLITDNTLCASILFAFSVIYVTVAVCYFWKQIRSYNLRMRNTYSNVEGRSLRWVHKLVIIFVALCCFWWASLYFGSTYNGIIYSILAILVWNYTLVRIHRQQPVQIGYHSVLASRKEPVADLLEPSFDVPKSIDDTANAAAAAAQAAAIEAADIPLVGDSFDAEVEDNSPISEIPTETPVDIEIFNARIVDTDDRRFSFASRLRSLIEIDQIYLRPDLNINELARILGTNRAYLSSYLNTVIGVSFFDYINAYRLQHACRLLLTTAYTIDQVSDESGFNNTYSFRRVFVRRYGITPTEWRHTNSKE